MTMSNENEIAKLEHDNTFHVKKIGIFVPGGELFTINNSFVRNLEMPSRINEKSDVKCSVKGDYASGASTCTMAVRGWLE